MSVQLDGDGGTIAIARGVLSQIVLQAAEGVEGARVRRPRRNLEIAVDGRSARVELGLVLRYGTVLHEAARAVQERVAEALRTMCGLDVTAVDVSVEELTD